MIATPPASARSQPPLRRLSIAIAIATSDVEHAVWIADRRPGEAELVGDAAGDVVLLVAEHDLELAEAAGQVGARHQVALVVRRVVHAAEDADRPGARLGHMARVLERVPRHLEEVAVLRIDAADASSGEMPKKPASNSSTSSSTPRAGT